MSTEEARNLARKRWDAVPSVPRVCEDCSKTVYTKRPEVWTGYCRRCYARRWQRARKQNQARRC